MIDKKFGFWTLFWTAIASITAVVTLFLGLIGYSTDFQTFVIEKSSLDVKMQDAFEENPFLKAEIKQLNDQIVHRDQTIENLTAQNSGLESKVEALTQSVNDLRIQSSQNNSDKTDANITIGQLQSVIAELESENSVLSSENQSMRQQLAEFGVDSDDLSESEQTTTQSVSSRVTFEDISVPNQAIASLSQGIAIKAIWKATEPADFCGNFYSEEGIPWYESDYDASSWSIVGLPDIKGRGEYDVFYRGYFSLTGGLDELQMQTIRMTIDHADGIKVYINGTEILGSKLSEKDNFVCHSNYEKISSMAITEFLKPGINIIAIHLTNSSYASQDSRLNVYLEKIED